jgi:hypothetical protein
MISERTKAGLQAAKRRGAKLGGLNAKGIENQRAAAERAEQLRPIFAEFAGMSARQSATELNRRGIETPAGGSWHATQVIRIRERLAHTREETWGPADFSSNRIIGSSSGPVIGQLLASSYVLRYFCKLRLDGLEFWLEAVRHFGHAVPDGVHHVGTRWAEIDIPGKVWTVPAERMKAGKEHVIPAPSLAHG